jgi:hypothetical protein
MMMSSPLMVIIAEIMILLLLLLIIMIVIIVIGFPKARVSVSRLGAGVATGRTDALPDTGSSGRQADVVFPVRSAGR